MRDDEAKARIKKLKNAVWAAWLASVSAGMGSGTPTDMVNQYGFTGAFAGLEVEYSHPLEVAEALNDIF